MAEKEQHTDHAEDEIPPSLVGHTFIVPKKEINMVPDMGKWKRSQAYADYIGFVLALNEAVKGKKLTDDYTVSEEAESLVSTVIPVHLSAAVPEVALYLKESVGNSTRIDYGTGNSLQRIQDLGRCLEKFPVIQHFKFGSLLPIQPVKS
ncbi:hypothetical protein XELAEV_18003332mg [Xenopus laevis]|nr:hypothetical protein XELAEV_18003332mg [Xenopus laevis]